MDLLSDPAGRIFLCGIVWSVSSCGLMIIVWARWLRSKAERRFDPGFIVGNLLCSTSCFSFALSYVLLVLPHTQEGRIQEDLTAFAWLCLIGLVVIPFGCTRLKWRSLLICIGNPIIFLIFFFLYGE